jgi:hypothetical protein
MTAHAMFLATTATIHTHSMIATSASIEEIGSTGMRGTTDSAPRRPTLHRPAPHRAVTTTDTIREMQTIASVALQHATMTVPHRTNSPSVPLARGTRHLIALARRHHVHPGRTAEEAAQEEGTTSVVTLDSIRDVLGGDLLLHPPARFFMRLAGQEHLSSSKA